MTTTLRALLEGAMDRRGVASGRALADLTADRRDTIDRTQVNQILKGTYKSRPRVGTLRAIAWLAQVDEADAFRAAEIPQPGPPFANELPPDADYLRPQQRQAVITVIRAFLASAEEEGGEVGGDHPPMNDPDSGPGNNVHELGRVQRPSLGTPRKAARDVGRPPGSPKGETPPT